MATKGRVSSLFERRGGCRFKLYSFDEVGGMSEEAWQEECTRNGADSSSPEDEVIAEVIKRSVG